MAEHEVRPSRCPRCDAPIYSDETECHYHGLEDRGAMTDALLIAGTGVLLTLVALSTAICR